MRSLVRQPVASVAAAGCVAVGVAVAIPLLSLARWGAGWPPEPAPALGPAVLTGPLGASRLAWSPEATGVDAMRAADLEAMIHVLLVVGVVAILAAAVAVWVLVAARTRRRGRELRVRAAVGVGASDLRRQLREEAALLAVSGALLGAVLGTALAGGFRAAGGRGLVWQGGFPVAAVLVSALPLLAAATAAPGAARWSGWSRRPADRTNPGPAPFQDLLVVGAVAGLVVVVVGAGLLVRSYGPRVDPGAGISASNVAVLRLGGPGAGRIDRRQADRALTVVDGHPEALGRAVAARGAWAGQGPVDRVVAQCLCWRGGAFLPVITSRLAHAAVGPGFFEALGVELVEGRTFRREDGQQARKVAVVDRRFLRLTGGTSPVGKWIRVAGATLSAAGAAEDRHRIVGVVEARRFAGVGARGGGAPLVYLPAYLHPPGRPDLIVRTRKDPGSTGRQLARSLRAEVAGLQVEAATLADRAGDLRAPLVWAARGLEAAAGGILLVALLAVGGLVADETRRQRAEMALRRAVGARRRQVIARVLKRALGLGARAAIVGFIAAGGLAASLDDLLYGLRIRDPLPWILALAVLMGAAVAGALVPAIRAAREDPARWLGVNES